LEGDLIKNKIQLKAWLAANTSSSAVDLVPCFPDVLALLGMAGRSTKDDVVSLDLESKAVKAGYGSVNHFLISKSFSLALPTIFGTEKEGGTGDARTLPRFKTFESFDSQEMFTGGLNDVKQKVKKEQEATRAHIEHWLAGSAKLVAKACLAEANAFITELLAWMSATYHMLSKVGGNTSSTENWSYVCHSVRAIFSHLQRARATGYGTKDAANMIWGCLRGQIAANEMLSISFRKHSVVANVLNDHLQHSAIMRDEFDSVIKGLQVGQVRLNKELESVKTVADRALQKAGKG
jgi:hypothetical protein